MFIVVVAAVEIFISKIIFLIFLLPSGVKIFVVVAVFFSFIVFILLFI